MRAPLDHTNVHDPRNASIALVRYPAGGGSTPRSDVIGSLLLNPGGPGGSGIGFATNRKEALGNVTVAESFDEILDHRYDIVSFDPRGVGRTDPKADCFRDRHSSYINAIQNDARGFTRSHSSNDLDFELGLVLSQTDLVAQLCAADPTRKDALAYMSTPFVARDMKLLHTALGDEKIHYWGFSYGSVLGSVFADMFPDDVGRLAIDGVVDVPNYMRGEWSDNFKDIEQELDEFFNECAKAGPRACKLASLSRDADKLKDKVMSWAEGLKSRPMLAINTTAPQLLTYSQVNGIIFQALYTPSTWPQIAEALEAGIRGNANPLSEKVSQTFEKSSGNRAQNAIACGDALTPPADWTIDQYRKHLSVLEKDSPLFAHAFGEIGAVCLSSWKIRAKERHEGDFTSRTSFPVLTLGNDLDPVTPGRYADLMASKFPGAVAVRRAQYGHCSISQPSKCISRIIKGYFVEGVVPKHGTFCDVDRPVFPDPDSVSSLEDDEESRATVAIAEALADVHHAL